MLIDTGGRDEISLSGGAFDLLRLEKRLHVFSRKAKFETASGEITVREGVLDEFVLGSFRHQHLFVTRSASVRGGIGMGYLSRYLVTFDFPQKKVYLKPGAAFDRKSQRDALGARILLLNNEVSLNAIEVGSPAEEEQLKAGDVLLEVNGRSVREFSLFELRAIFSKPEETAKLKLRQSDNIRTVNVTLRDY